MSRQQLSIDLSAGEETKLVDCEMDLVRDVVYGEQS